MYSGPERRLRPARPLPAHLERRSEMRGLVQRIGYRSHGQPGRVGAYWTEPEHVMLSIVMPVHNEEETILHAVHGVLGAAIPCPFELIVVNDGSTDRTQALLETIDDEHLACIQQHCNLGKGAAVRSAIALARGTHLLVFDADLEYDASDIAALVAPVLESRSEVVYGARVAGMNTVFPSLKYAAGNRLTTTAANLMFGSHLTDMHTCLKLIPIALLRSMTLRETGFGLDTEITGEILRRGIRPFEVPISYTARSHSEGKKIRAIDGLRCIYVLAKVRARGTEHLPPRAVVPHRASHSDRVVDLRGHVLDDELVG